MAEINKKNINGDLEVGRNVAAGGSLSVSGKTELSGRVVVKDWLDAPNIVGPNKGLFEDEDALKEAYPRPMSGWWAMTNAEPTDTGEVTCTVWRAYKGKWIESGVTSLKVSVPDVTTSETISTLQNDVTGLQEGLNTKQNTLKYYSEGDVYVLITVDETELSMAAEGASITTQGKFWYNEKEVATVDDVSGVQENVTQEVQDREKADIKLQENITLEAEARANAVTNLQTTLQANITSEAKTREENDNTLQANIDKKQDTLKYYKEGDGYSLLTITADEKTTEVSIAPQGASVDTEGKFWYNEKEVATVNDVSEAAESVGGTARFNGMTELGDTELVEGKLEDEPEGILWLCDKKIFVAVKASVVVDCGTEAIVKTYYTDWDGSELYMVTPGESGALRKDKVYIHGGSVYVWMNCEDELVKAGGIADSIITEEEIDELLEGFEFVDVDNFVTKIEAEGAGLMELEAGIEDGVASIKGHTTIGCVGYDDVVEMFENVEI